jgi:sialic acid synthase SpsE
MLREAADEYGLLVVTEVVDSAHVEIVDEYADILQIGTRNMANFSLLKKIGEVTAESASRSSSSGAWRRPSRSGCRRATTSR